MRYTIFFLSLIGLSSLGQFAGCLRTLPHVLDYDVVRPQKLITRAKRSASSTQTYPDELRYALTVEGKNLTVHLEKNRLLIGKHYTETHYLDDGTEVTTSPNYEDHCYYHGYIQGVEDSSVSFGVCSGIRGFLRAEDQVYLIEPLDESAEGDHAVYRQDHLRGKRSACVESNKTAYDHGSRVSGLYKISNWETQPQSLEVKRFVEMYMVVDNAEYKKHGASMKTIQARMLEVANHVDKLYRPLNIRVMLVGLEVWTYQDKMDVSLDPDKTLTRFLQWRQESLLKRKKHDNAQLVTGVDFEGTTVGLATKFAMCTGGSGAVNEDHNANPIGVASTIAHEMGHNLGMSHDASYCTCGSTGFSRNCIMADSVGFIFPKEFSSCSQTELKSFLEKANPSCLLDTPSTDQLFGGPVCGNAFVEAGEECDCGTVEECQNPCCNATTCRLNAGAECAHGECCQSCQLKQAGSLCRKSGSDCDLPEYCTGKSSECPSNVFKMNGLPCNSDQGYCFNGHCPTHQQHCNKLWGPGARVAEDVCFYKNTEGSRDAHCGRLTYGYKKCQAKDIKCGRIFCNGGNEFPITGLKGIVNIGFRTQCNIAIDLAETDNIGMVPTGTKCGDNKVCYNQLCQDIKVYGTEDCSKKCSNHGVCNHEKACHCDPGWAPPYCDVRISDLPTEDSNVVIIAASIAGAVLVLLSIIAGAMLCFRKPRKPEYPTKKKVNSASGLSNPLFLEGVEGRSPHRPPPQPPKNIPAQKSHPVSPQVAKPSISPPVAPNKPSHLKAKPQPPAKPLPPLTGSKQVNKPKPPPLYSQ
ncbi:hypothetical protein AGOR_G00114190 [Albula goreensis]|uniref:Disintegrin and metalloproteinase domain-containing protein 8 n=1 Tax=Albula goreensis TaxID=1534307 RepID=A0A8T3DDI5_9TELE|nr:hypothetical protein AGOR_G00114190 [Albula goreensis]